MRRCADGSKYPPCGTAPRAANEVARTLTAIGDRWSLLVVYEALGRPRRFEDFERNLGVAPNILADRLRYLAELGIVPGVDVRVVAREPFEGPIALEVHNAKRTVGPGLASQILVTLVAAKRPRPPR